MKAIETKYLGPTYRRGGRIRASDGDRNAITIPYDHRLDSETAHRKAAESLKNKMGWEGELVGGWLKKGTWVWVFET